MNVSHQSVGRRNMWIFPPPIVRRYVRVVGIATIIFGLIVITVTVLFGYIVIRLGQLGPYAEQVFEKLMPMIGIGIACEILIFGIGAYLLATYLAYKMAGPFVRLERELEISLKQEIIRPLRVRSGDAMEGFITKVNALIDSALAKGKSSTN